MQLKSCLPTSDSPSEESDLDLDAKRLKKEDLKPIGHFLNDREEMIEQVWTA